MLETNPTLELKPACVGGCCANSQPSLRAARRNVGLSTDSIASSGHPLMSGRRVSIPVDELSTSNLLRPPRDPI